MAWEKIIMDKPTIPTNEEYYIQFYRGKKKGFSTGVRGSFSANVSKIIVANNYKAYTTMIDKEECKVGIQFLTEENGGGHITITQNTSSSNATPRTSFAFSNEWIYILDTLELNDFEKSAKFTLTKEDDNFFVFDCKELKK